ncbi:coagulation factor 5/8 type domain-containing protein [Granulicella sp. S190]|uniref:coagulation factor 5/8 type domain-containing protein n=1 Tax=Granulicella sp. S190 TaxID=1747226 RepID=UPI0020B123B5|nr:coagulation factor 5/8 type domain-containing protein [Granulicella sp. S190]
MLRRRQLQYASGGFIADSQTTFVINGSQQQFYVRDSSLGGWSNAVWNQVFSGVANAPTQSYPNPTYTTLATTPISREKPFLYLDAKGNYNVFVPAVQKNSSGVIWANGTAPGTSKSIENFFIANPNTSVAEINLALLFGKSLILTPGVYKLNQSINVLYPNTVVLGLGFATLVPQTGKPAITVTDVDGVQIAGLILDAGPVNSPTLIQLGSTRLRSLDNRFGINLFRNHSANPSSLSDIFIRIGGATAGSATTSIEVNSNDVLLDDIWAWRADHGAGVGWTLNTADHGLVVNGDRVTALGLAVEHYQKEQVLWNGNAGENIFYQSELPYDPPSQTAWMDGSANGYPSYVVSKGVTSHQAYGLGIYSFFDLGVNIVEDNAMTVPNAAGVSVNDIGTVFLNGSGSITHVINDTGGSVSSANGGTVSPVITYP